MYQLNATAGFVDCGIVCHVSNARQLGWMDCYGDHQLLISQHRCFRPSFSTQDVQRLVPEDCLARVLGKRYACSTLWGLPPTCQAAMEVLGVQRFGAAHMVALLKQIGPEAMGLEAAAVSAGSAKAASKEAGGAFRRAGDGRSGNVQMGSWIWEILALLEDLLTQPQGASRTAAAHSTASRSPAAIPGPGSLLQPQQVQALVSELADVGLLPLRGGRMGTPAAGAFLPPNFPTDLSDLAAGSQTGAAASGTRQAASSKRTTPANAVTQRTISSGAGSASDAGTGTGTASDGGQSSRLRHSPSSGMLGEGYEYGFEDQLSLVEAAGGW